MKVKCPNCRRVLFETSEKYDPNVTPNGSMVRPLVTYQIDWLCSSVTSAAEMTCPECLAQLAPSGRLLVLESEAAPVSPMEIGLPGREPEPCVCEECGREFKNAMALRGHRKMHRKGNDNG